MRIELRECSLDDKEDILDMLLEIGPGENGFMNDGYNLQPLEFRDFLFKNINSSKGIDLLIPLVPSTRYWLIADGNPVGYGKLRHYLNKNLRKIGGHIGYCIRPSARGKGYGSILLGEMLKKAAGKNIPRALVTCLDTNAASRGVAEHNGGKLDSIVDGECYYWINLDESTGMREIHPDDYMEIVDLWSSTPGMGMSRADSEDSITRFLLRNPGLSFCFKECGKIIATILCGHDGRRGYIYHVMTAPEYRGRGIAVKLAEKSLRCLKEAGIDKCHLFVFADNEPGNAFWSSTCWIKRDDILLYSKNT
jgi:predicted acetyltransferase/predicted GNAT family acetyltransferase